MAVECSDAVFPSELLMVFQKAGKHRLRSPIRPNRSGRRYLRGDREKLLKVN
jgi:hypothetical protein